MTKYLKYLNYVLRHKWFVFLECCKRGIPWLGLVHDWSKLRPSEFIPYARHFYGRNRDEQFRKEKIEGYDKAEDQQDNTFNKAWLYHIHRNKHHWQYWLLIQDEDKDIALEIPHRYRKELLADWTGAGKAITGRNNNRTWYLKNKDRMKLGPITREHIEKEVLLCP